MMRRNVCAQTHQCVACEEAGSFADGDSWSDVVAYRSVCRDVRFYDLPVFFKMDLSRALEVVEEKEKFSSSSFFLLFDFENSPESAQLLYSL
jgi:hypothetical protein